MTEINRTLGDHYQHYEDAVTRISLLDFRSATLNKFFPISAIACTSLLYCGIPAEWASAIFITYISFYLISKGYASIERNEKLRNIEIATRAIAKLEDGTDYLSKDSYDKKGDQIINVLELAREISPFKEGFSFFTRVKKEETHAELHRRITIQQEEQFRNFDAKAINSLPEDTGHALNYAAYKWEQAAKKDGLDSFTAAYGQTMTMKIRDRIGELTGNS